MLTVLQDFREQPQESFDGLEPATLPFHPVSFGLPGFEPVDLVAACSTRPERTLSQEVQRELQSLAPSRVRAFDKSWSCWESLLGYYAISRSLSARTDRLIILFSFFEVSPARFHAYLHALLKAADNAA